ncbi:MAG: Mur ligase domain-containing protein [Deltaproteobacteria bacterium]|nr:Mur ligase domain-containing protein [Deltaproteobacteria bacterium]
MSQPTETLTENPLLPRYNAVPHSPKHIHLLGICRTGMASLAGMLKSIGYRVTGSDKNVYPPMSTFLADLSIPVFEGYDPGHLMSSPDLVIVGNVIRRDNPEAQALGRMKLPYLSLPQALARFAFSGKKTVVVSGTHGKTTTASLAAWVLEAAGRDRGL